MIYRTDFWLFDGVDLGVLRSQLSDVQDRRPCPEHRLNLLIMDESRDSPPSLDEH